MYIVQEKRKGSDIANRTKNRLHKTLEPRTKLFGRERNLGFIEVDVEKPEDIPQHGRFVVQEWDVDHLRTES